MVENARIFGEKFRILKYFVDSQIVKLCVHCHIGKLTDVLIYLYTYHAYITRRLRLIYYISLDIFKSFVICGEPLVINREQIRTPVV